MTTRCRIIIIMLLSLIFNQTMAGVWYGHGAGDGVEHSQKSTAYPSGEGVFTGDEHCDSADPSDAFCCCGMMVSECGTNPLCATGIKLVLANSDTWLSSNFLRRYGYSPDIEPRPPRD